MSITMKVIRQYHWWYFFTKRIYIIDWSVAMFFGMPFLTGLVIGLIFGKEYL